MTSRLAGTLLAGLLITAVGCDRADQSQERSSETTAAASGNEATTTRPVKPVSYEEYDPKAEGDRSEVRSVYPSDVKPDPRAIRLCDTIWKLPRERRVECCGGKPSGIRPEERCIDALSTALADDAVTLDESALKKCEAEATARLSECGWVGNLAPPPPSVCRRLLAGTRGAGETCRASTECAEGLRCAGAGPTDPGTCREPGPTGAACNTGVDALASATLQLGGGHPECKGWCRSNRCHEATAVGESCKTSVECGVGNHCDGEQCQDGLAAAGESCGGGGCVDGARCVDGRCVVPSPGGDDCENDLECLGACVDGACGKRCERVIAR